jgi:RNA polymerase sigma factor (TIGR02999 family)
VPNACQIAIHGPDTRLAGTVDHIVTNTQVEPVCRAEVRMARELHDLELTESLGQPIADRRTPQIVGTSATIPRNHRAKAIHPSGDGASRAFCLEIPACLRQNTLMRGPKRWGTGMSDVTRILNAIEGGDTQATDELLPLVYEELRLLAAQKLSHEPPGQTLQATALVHEAYLRLVEAECQTWNSRNHFFMAAAEAMRRILIERARRKSGLKYGGDRGRVDLDDVVLPCDEQGFSANLLALDEALEKLSQVDRVKADVVKLRYFAGLTIEQTAEILSVSVNTVKRCWAYARAWLLQEIG